MDPAGILRGLVGHFLRTCSLACEDEILYASPPCVQLHISRHETEGEVAASVSISHTAEPSLASVHSFFDEVIMSDLFVQSELDVFWTTKLHLTFSSSSEQLIHSFYVENVSSSSPLLVSELSPYEKTDGVCFSGMEVLVEIGGHIEDMLHNLHCFVSGSALAGNKCSLFMTVDGFSEEVLKELHNPLASMEKSPEGGLCLVYNGTISSLCPAEESFKRRVSCLEHLKDSFLASGTARKTLAKGDCFELHVVAAYQEEAETQDLVAPGSSPPLMENDVKVSLLSNGCPVHMEEKFLVWLQKKVKWDSYGLKCISATSLSGYGLLRVSSPNMKGKLQLWLHKTGSWKGSNAMQGSLVKTAVSEAMDFFKLRQPRSFSTAVQGKLFQVTPMLSSCIADIICASSSDHFKAECLEILGAQDLADVKQTLADCLESVVKHVGRPCPKSGSIENEE